MHPPYEWSFIYPIILYVSKNNRRFCIIDLIVIFIGGEIKMVYEARRTQLLAKAKEKQIQYVLVKDPANVFYYTGFLAEPHERFMAYTVQVDTGKERLFVPALDETAAQQATDVKDIVPITDTDNPLDIVEQAFGKLSGTIGIEGKAMSYYLISAFEKQFPHINWLDVQQIMNEQRLIKSDEEITALKKAIQLIEDVLYEGIKQIKVGMSEAEIVANLEFTMRKLGADGPSFDTIVLSGKKAALPHGIPGEDKLQEGDLLLIDFGVMKDGYCSDITRTFAIGEVDDRKKAIYEIVRKANEAGIEAIKAGRAFKHFDQAARDVITNAGYGEYFTTRVGHGLGIEVHEEPSIHGENEAVATSGSVFTIEPGIYIPNDIGVRIEDIVYINDEGQVEVLTSFPKQLQTIATYK